MIYDITRKVTAALPVWPGDTPFQVTPMLCKAEGASVNLTTLTMTAHLGTHADAYYHYADDGAFIGEMPLEAYIGPARVVTVTKADGPLMPDDVGEVQGAQRLLVHSPVSELGAVWPEQFPYLSVTLIDWLAGQGIRLIGLDSPSVDAFDSTDLPCHHALRRHHLVNLEALDLRAVPDGDYELVALPLCLDGACGSPVRAILRKAVMREA
jgi:arylformamidase